MNGRHGLLIVVLFSLFFIILVQSSTVFAQGTPPDDGRANGRYIVVFKDGTSSARRASVESSTQSPTRIYTSALNGFAAKMTSDDALQLRRDPTVALVERDKVIYLASQPLPRGINRVDIEQNSTANIDGVDERIDVDVAILDTGLDIDHPDLNIAGGRHFYGGTSEDGNFDDDNGHGTHVGGVVGAIDNDSGSVGVAPGARLWGVKVLDSSGVGLLSDVIAGVDWVTANASTIEVANMSIEAQGQSSALRLAIQNSVAAGVVYTAAAGNDISDIFGPDGIFNTNDDFIPAAYPEVATVTAMADFDGSPGGNAIGSFFFTNCTESEDDSFACFSNYSTVDHTGADKVVNSSGAAIDLMMPGVFVLSTWNDGGIALNSGTSVAAPHAAGMAALYISENGRATDAAGVYSIRQTLIDNAKDQSSGVRLSTLDETDSNADPLGWNFEMTTLGDFAPSASIVNPLDSSTVSGIVTVQVDASDAEDPVGTLTVEYSIDGGSYLPMAYNPLSGFYESIWDTALVSEGGHTVDARATDSFSNTTDASQISVTVNNLLSDIAISSINAASSSVVLGDSVSVDVVVENVGSVTASNISVALNDLTDSVPIGFEILPTLPVGSTSTVSFTWDTTGASLGPHVVEGRHFFIDENLLNDAITMPIIVVAPLLDVAVTSVSTTPTLVNQGDSVSVDVVVENVGNQDASGFDVSLNDVTDTVSLGTQSLATLPVGASSTISFVWDTTSASVAGHTLEGQHGLVDGNTANDVASASVTVDPSLVLDVAITSVTPALATVTQGDSLNVDVVVQNIGEINAGSFVVSLNNLTDSALIGTQTVTGLPIGATSTLSFIWDTSNTSINTHTLEGSHDFSDDVASNDVLTTSVTVDAPFMDVGVISVAPSSNNVTQGDSLSVDVTVANLGDADASNFNVSLTDTTDGVAIGTQLVSVLPIGATSTLSFLWDTSGASIASHVLDGSHDLPDDNSTNDSASASVTVDAPFVDVAVSAVSPSVTNVTQGDNLSVDVTVVNIGDANVGSFNVSLTDVTDSTLIGSQIVSGLPVNSTSTLTFLWDTSSAVIGPHDLNGTHDLPDDNVGNDSGITLVTVDPPFMDVAITSVAASSPSVIQGDNLSIDVIVANVGDDNASNFNVSLTDTTDSLTIGTQLIASLPIGSTSTLTFIWDTSEASIGLHNLDGSHDLADDNPSNDSNATSTTVAPPFTDVAIASISASPVTATQGENVSLDVVVSNVGDADVSNVNVSLNDLTDNSLIGSQLISSLPVNSTTTLTFIWNTSSSSVSLHTLEASHDLADDNSSNDTNSTSVTVDPQPVLDVAVISVTPDLTSVTQGDSVNVDVVVQNVGDLSAGGFNVTLTDTTDSLTIGTQSVAGLSIGATSTLTFVWDTSSSSIGTHILDGSQDLSDDNGANDSGTTSVAVDAPFVDISIVSVNSTSTSIVQGGNVSVDVVVANTGDTEVVNLTVLLDDLTDSSPIGSQLISSLPVNSTTTLIFIWDTSGSSIGAHVLEGSHNLPDDDSSNDLDTTSVTVDAPFTDVGVVSVSAPSSNVTQGDSISVDVTLQNLGDADVSNFNVALTDLTDSATIGSQAIANLPRNSTSTLTFFWDTTASSIGSHSLEASHDFDDDNSSNDTGSIGITVDQPPIFDVAIVSVNSTSTNVVQGDNLSVDVVIQNIGDLPASGFNVTLTDVTDSVVVDSQLISNLDSGATTTLTYLWDTPNASIGSHSLEGSHDLSDDNSLNDFASDSVTVDAPFVDIAVISVNSSSTSVIQGDSVSVDVILENVGDVDVFNFNASLFDLTDNVSLGSQLIASLPVNSSTTATFIWDTSGASLSTHILEGRHDIVDNNSANDLGTVLVNVDAPPLLDVAVISLNSSSTSVVMGESVNVDLVVQNVGDVDVSDFDVTLTDVTDSVVVGTQTLQSLISGSSTTLSFVWDTSGASIGSHNLEGRHDLLDDNSANDFNSTSIVVDAPFTDVAITLVNSTSTSAVLGESVSVEVVVANTGDADVTGLNVTLTDTTDSLQIGSQLVSSLPKNSSSTLTFIWDTTQASLGSHILQAQHDLADDNPANDSGSLYVTVDTPPVLDIAIASVTSSSTSAVIGENVSVDIVVTNIGNLDAGSFNILLNDLTDSVLVGTVNVPDLTASSSTTVTFNWNTFAASIGSHILEASHDLPDGNAANDLGTLPITIDAPFTDVAITLVNSSSTIAVLGESVSVDVVVANVGDSDVPGFNVTLTDVTDSIPLGSQFISSLPVNSTTTTTFVWDTSGASIGSHVLQGSHDLADDNTANDSGTTSITIDAPPVLDVAIVSLSSSSTNVTLGDDVDVSVEVTNIGDIDASNVTIELRDLTNSVTIDSLVISSLTAGATTTVNFIWDTSAASVGGHTLEGSHDLADDNSANDSGTLVVNVDSPPILDIAITSMNSSSTSATVGDDVSIAVTVTNVGGLDSGNFDVTLTDLTDSLTIDTQSVANLSEGASTILNFTWGTLGASIGSHLLEAEHDLSDSNTSNDSSQISIQIDSGSVVVTEDWTGAHASPWPSRWSFDGDEQVNLIDIISNTGRLGDESSSSSTEIVTAFINTTEAENVDASIKFNISSNEMGFGLIARRSDTDSDTYYYSHVQGNKDKLKIYKSVDGVETKLGQVTVPVIAPEIGWYIRFAVETNGPATELKTKVWLATDPEPINFQLVTTDGEPTLQGESGRFGMRYELFRNRIVLTNNYLAQ